MRRRGPSFSDVGDETAAVVVSGPDDDNDDDEEDDDDEDDVWPGLVGTLLGKEGVNDGSIDSEADMEATGGDEDGDVDAAVVDFDAGADPPASTAKGEEEEEGRAWAATCMRGMGASHILHRSRARGLRKVHAPHVHSSAFGRWWSEGEEEGRPRGSKSSSVSSMRVWSCPVSAHRRPTFFLLIYFRQFALKGKI